MSSFEFPDNFDELFSSSPQSDSGFSFDSDGSDFISDIPQNLFSDFSSSFLDETTKQKKPHVTWKFGGYDGKPSSYSERYIFF